MKTPRWHSLLFFVPLLMLAGVAVWVVGVERERAEESVRHYYRDLVTSEASYWDEESLSLSWGRMYPDIVVQVPIACFEPSWSLTLSIPQAAELQQWSGPLGQWDAARRALADGDKTLARQLLRALMNVKHFDAVYLPSGLPLKPLVLRALLDVEPIPLSLGEELFDACFRYPSPISIKLIEDAASVVGDKIYGSELFRDTRHYAFADLRNFDQNAAAALGYPRSTGAGWRKKTEILRLLSGECGNLHQAYQYPEPYIDLRGQQLDVNEAPTRWSREAPWLRHGDTWWFADFSTSYGLVRVVSLDEIEAQIFRRRDFIRDRVPQGTFLRYRWHEVALRDDRTIGGGDRLGMATNGPLEVYCFSDGSDAWRGSIDRRTYAMAKKAGAGWAAAGLVLLGVWLVYRKHMKLAALQADFIASVSHELRTPVAGISALAERLEAGKVTGEADLRQYHRFIAREGRRLAALIDNVLDFSRIEQDRKQYVFRPLDYSKLVSEVVALLRGHAEEKGVRLVEDVRGNEDSTVPNGDAVAMRQVLVNLLDNAIKFTPSGGMVTVLLEPVGTAGLRLAVTDSGPGIAGGEIKRIFDRFYRADNGLTRETTGAGIGLSIVKAIVEAHGGTVSARNERGGGATFEVLLGKWRPTA
ncbi:MAG: HAMP domain-containing sensor histidine kinase [Verrucomicrobiales bacterium]